MPTKKSIEKTAARKKAANAKTQKHPAKATKQWSAPQEEVVDANPVAETKAGKVKPEAKYPYSVSLMKEEKEYLITKYGGLNKAIDTLIPGELLLKRQRTRK